MNCRKTWMICEIEKIGKKIYKEQKKKLIQLNLKHWRPPFIYERRMFLGREFFWNKNFCRYRRYDYLYISSTDWITALQLNMIFQSVVHKASNEIVSLWSGRNTCIYIPAASSSMIVHKVIKWQTQTKVWNCYQILCYELFWRFDEDYDFSFLLTFAENFQTTFKVTLKLLYFTAVQLNQVFSCYFFVVLHLICANIWTPSSSHSDIGWCHMS